MTQYVCPRCQLGRLYQLARPAFLTRASQAREVLTSPLRHHRRLAHTASSTAPSVSVADFDPVLHDKALRQDALFEGTPDVREHFRSWSRQRSEAVKAWRIETGIPAKGRVWSLPDALFMGEDSPEYASVEEQEEMERFEDSIEGSNLYKLEPGDLLSLSSPNARRQYAIYLGYAETQSLFLLANGRYVQMRMRNQISLQIPGFAPEEEVHALRDRLPKRSINRPAGEYAASHEVADFIGDPPRDLAAPLVDRMSRFATEVLEFRRTHADLLDSIYERLAKQDEYVQLDFNTLLRQLLGHDADRLANAGKMAVFMMSQRQPTKMAVCAEGKNARLQILVGPRRLVAQFEKVVEWAREYQETAASASKGQNVAARLRKNPVNLFINKARKIITASRKLRSPTTLGCLGPSRANANASGAVTMRETGETFSDTDKSILEFIWDTYLRLPSGITRSKHEAIASLILRAIGAYPKMVLEPNIGRLLLQELGVMAPWAERGDDHVTFPVPGRKGAHKTDELLKASDGAAKKLGFEIGASRIPLVDSMAEMREDLGQMEVFCVDAKGTEIVDDGISLEACAERPGYYWFHAHIAHPTAYIEPESIFAKFAQHQGSAWYTTKVVYPLLPTSVGRSISLRSGSSAITISTLLSEDGQVHSIKIRPTRINNVIKLEHGPVDELLGRRLEEKAVLIVGSDPSIDAKASSEGDVAKALDAARPFLPTLKKMSALLEARIEQRTREIPDVLDSWIEPKAGTCQISFLEEYEATRLHRSLHYIGDPTIKIEAPKHTPRFRWSERIGADGLIGQAMVLVGESAAKWFRDRNLPAMFVGSVTDPAFPLSKLNAASAEEFVRQPKAVMSSTPMTHITVTLQQYMRMTSPLRRFPDLINMWNADAYLKAQYNGTITPDAAVPDDFVVPYSRKLVDDYIDSHSWVIDMGKRARDHAYTHWAMHALFRAFHFKECELPEVWEAQMRRSDRKYSPYADATVLAGTILPFGHFCRFLATPEGWETQARPGYHLPVKIETVDVTHNMVYVRAVGPPTAERTLIPDGAPVYQSKERRLAAEKEAARKPLQK